MTRISRFSYTTLPLASHTESKPNEQVSADACTLTMKKANNNYNNSNNIKKNNNNNNDDDDDNCNNNKNKSNREIASTIHITHSTIEECNGIVKAEG